MNARKNHDIHLLSSSYITQAIDWQVLCQGHDLFCLSNYNLSKALTEWAACLFCGGSFPEQPRKVIFFNNRKMYKTTKIYHCSIRGRLVPKTTPFFFFYWLDLLLMIQSSLSCGGQPRILLVYMHASAGSLPCTAVFQPSSRDFPTVFFFFFMESNSS